MYISPALLGAVVFLDKHRNRPYLGTGHSLLVAAVVFLDKHRNGAHLGRTGYIHVYQCCYCGCCGLSQINTGKGHSWVGLGIDMYSSAALVVAVVLPGQR